MNPFVSGFLKRANEHNLGNEVMQTLSDLFKHNRTTESLYSLADGSKTTGEEAGRFAGHIGNATLGGVGKGALIGGAIGGLHGFGGSKPLSSTLRGATKGALIGGGIEGGRTAYELGDNTRSATLQPFENELEFKKDQLSQEELEKLQGNIKTMKDSPWFQYYYPPSVFGKLK